MTNNKLTSEEKHLWINWFQLFEPLVNSARRTKALYKKYGQMVNGEIVHTSQELINIEIQFLSAREMTERIRIKYAENNIRLIQLNPNYEQN